jgi:hypothetical protein
MSIKEKTKKQIFLPCRQAKEKSAFLFVKDMITLWLPYPSEGNGSKRQRS